MKLSMLVDFQILENINGKYIPLSNNEARSVSIGGFGFEVNGNSIPFDWDAFSGTEENKIFQFETGRGFLCNDYEIPDYWDKDYEEIGISRDDITAEFLASTTHINEFFVDFEDTNGEECQCGWYTDNRDDNRFKIKLLEMTFYDLDADKYYDVSKKVLDNYNKGE